jgi:SCF-associated factor 1
VVHETLLRCGRSFAVALDQRGNIWIFVAWGIPYRYEISMAHESRIVDIECGWDSACALTEDGDVYFWRPQDGELWARYRRHTEGNSEPKIVEVDGTVNCQPWEVTDVNALNLPPIPSNLPPLKDGGKSGLEAKLVKVAAGWHFLIGLTNGGHVLGMSISGLTGAPDQVRPGWIYVGSCDPHSHLG